jgi:CubicO group peptidase (beta-lactamase class C family)
MSWRDTLGQYFTVKQADGSHLGLSFGVLKGDTMEFANYGVRTMGSSEAVCEDSLFEIASVGKTFTALLIHRLACEGKWALDDPIQEWIPEISTREPLTIRSLLMHTSGLPREPRSFVMIGPKNSYLPYTEEMFSDDLAALEKTGEEGKFSYSSTGYMLLGLAAKRITGAGKFEALLEDKVMSVLDLPRTHFSLSVEQEKDIFPGHTPELEPVPPYVNLGEPFSPAGQLKSTVKDLLSYARMLVYTSMTPDTLRPAIDQTFVLTADQLSAGWHTRELDDEVAFFHAGSIAGNKVFLILSPKKKQAIAYFSNTLNHVTPVWEIYKSL